MQQPSTSAGRLRRLTWALAAGLAAAAAARAARGDDRDDEARRPPPPLLRTPAVRIEAPRPEPLPEDPSAFTTVLHTREFEGEGKRVEDLLELVPGVQVRRFGGAGEAVELSIRGSTASQVVVLLDGVRLNTAQSGAVDLSSVPAGLLERIEVTRGGGSVQVGSDAVGGVVNLVTRRESARALTSFAGSGGSFGTWQGSLSQTGRVGATELAAGAEYFRSEGDFEFQDAERVVDGEPRPGPERSFERINNHSENGSVLLSAGRDLGERWRLRASDAWFYESAGSPGLALQSAAVDAGQSATGHLRHARNLAQLRLEGTGLAGTGFDGWANLYHRYDRSQFRDPDPPQGQPQDSDNRNHSLGTRFEVSRALRLAPGREHVLAPGEHALSLGLELREDWIDSLDFGDHARGVVGVFSQDDVQLFGGALRLLPALRLDHTGGQGSAWLPRIGAILRVLPWLELKGNVERAYRVPNFDELYFDEGSLRGNPNLEPEDSLDADVGFELALERLGPLRELSLGFSAFRRDIEQSIVFQLLGQSVVVATNTGDARVRGIELGGGLRGPCCIAASGNLTLLDAEIEATGFPLPGRPDVEYVLRLELEPPGGLVKLVGEHHYVGEMPLAPGGRVEISARRTWDASLALDLARLPAVQRWLPLELERLALVVSGTNLGDQSVRDALGFPQPGRQLSFGVEGRR